MSSGLSAKIQSEIMNGYWSDLREHAERNAIFVVGADLDLLEVGVAIASDNAASVTGWITNGQLARPTMEQIKGWSETSQKTFLFLILQPHVLI